MAARKKTTTKKKTTTRRRRRTTKKPSYGKNAAIAAGRMGLAMSTGIGLSAARELGYSKHATIAAGVLTAGAVIAETVAPDHAASKIVGDVGRAAAANQLSTAISRKLIGAMDKSSAQSASSDDGYITNKTDYSGFESEIEEYVAADGYAADAA